MDYTARVDAFANLAATTAMELAACLKRQGLLDEDAVRHINRNLDLAARGLQADRPALDLVGRWRNAIR